MTPEAMLGAQLAPDMLPLSGQVQRASDTAKFALQGMLDDTELSYLLA
jgi:hypothetical protein